MCGGGGSKPKVEPAPPPPEQTKEPDKEIRKAGSAERNKAKAAQGVADTIKTSGKGLLTEAEIKKKSLLGQ